MSSLFTQNRLSPSGNIPLKLMEGYPRLRSSVDGSISATEVYLVESSNVSAFWQECSLQVDILADGKLNYILPMRFQGFPAANFPKLRCSNIEFEPYPSNKPGDPFGSHTGAAAGTYTTIYKATVTYEALQVDGGDSDTGDDQPDPDEPATYSVHTMTAGAQVTTTLPEKVDYATGDREAGNLVQDATGQVTIAAGDRAELIDKNSAMSKVVPTIEHNIRIPNYYRPDWDVVTRLIGLVNDKTRSHRFSDKLPRFKDAHERPETIMFLGWNAVPVRKIDPSDGTVIDDWFELELRFSERIIYYKDKLRGWNHVWNSHTQNWVMPLTGTSHDTPLYQWGDFSKLRIAATAPV